MFQVVLLPLLFLFLSQSPDTVSDNATVENMPKDQLFPTYIADVNASNTSLNIQSVTKKGIPHTSELRLETKIGTSVPLIRINTNNERNSAYEVTLGGAMVQHSDILEAWDIYGWDGVVETAISYKYSDEWVYKFGYKHISSHLGDEYVIGNDADRTGYTRDDGILAVKYSPNKSASYYVELAYRYNENDAYPDAGPLGTQFGFEFFKKNYYWATDFKSTDESDWNVSFNTEVGKQYFVKSKNYNARIGISYYAGPAELREFYRYNEQRIAAGIWIDI